MAYEDLPLPITCTVAGFRAVSGLAPSSTWKLIASGALETIVLGRRRLILVSSWERLVKSQQALGPGDARRNTTAASLGSTVARPAPQPEVPPQKRGRGRPRKAMPPVALSP
jgi:hypothetical protein